VAFFSLLDTQERTLRLRSRAAVRGRLDAGDLINAASPYCGADGGHRPRQRAIAPVGLHRPLPSVCR